MLEGPNNLVFDISHVRNADKVCWEYSTEDNLDPEEGWEQTDSGISVRISPKTLGLVTSGEYVHLKNISSSNIMEWYYRIRCLFDAGEYFLYTNTDEGDVPIQLNLHDLKDHIGLRLKTTGWSNTKFDSLIRSLRMKHHLREFLD